jgi:hypothetical protein
MRYRVMSSSWANVFVKKLWQKTTLAVLLSFGLASLPSYVKADNELFRAQPQFVGNAEDLNRMQVRVALPEERRAKRSPLQSRVEKDRANGGLTQVQLHRLSTHDIVLVIDKSSSMATPDCPTGESKLSGLSALILGIGDIAATRWNWCLEQTARMARQTAGVLTNGFTVVLFDSHFAVFPHVTVNDLARIFKENCPSGHTLLEKPLTSTFQDYFRRKLISRGNVKPLLIGIITDGCPTNPNAVREAVVDVTHEMKDPNEITIVFFLIGRNDHRGEQFAFDLSHNLVARGGLCQVVRSVPFWELEKQGLARALADNLQ